MIRRSRPKYLNFDDLGLNKKNSSFNNEEMYFNRGSSALKFLIEHYLKYYNLNSITICIQAFNCNTVIDSLLELDKVNILLCDVKLNDISVSLDYIKKNKEKFDVLLLTHYQGMINSQYNEIIDFCYTNNISIIEDMSQTNELFHQFRSNFAITSYAFDKPFTCMYGGSLKIREKDSFYLYLKDNYSLLPSESFFKTIIDLRTLYLLFIYSSETKYNRYVDLIINLPGITKFLPSVIVYIFFCNSLYYFITKITNRISFYIIRIYKRFNSSFKYKKIQYQKIYLIEKQKMRCSETFKTYETLSHDIISLLSENNITTYKDLHQNRISFINNNFNQKIIDKVECKCYNWPIKLFNKYKNIKNLVLENNYKNTEYLINNLLNIPCWSKEILKILIEK